MPLYEFLCRECGHTWEDMVRASEEDEVVINCPHCESYKLDRLFPMIGGYFMNSGPSSVRPKGAGSTPKKVK